MMLEIIPINLRDANGYVQLHHRNHGPVRGCKFAVAVAAGDQIVGVAIAGRPVSRMLDDGYTIELLRVATNGYRNACSKLYGACSRAGIAMGYRRVVTYTGASEPGTSLRAAGFRIVAEVRGRSWNCPSRPRVDRDETQDKFRWELIA